MTLFTDPNPKKLHGKLENIDAWRDAHTHEVLDGQQYRDEHHEALPHPSNSLPLPVVEVTQPGSVEDQHIRCSRLGTPHLHTKLVEAIVEEEFQALHHAIVSHGTRHIGEQDARGRRGQAGDLAVVLLSDAYHGLHGTATQAPALRQSPPAATPADACHSVPAPLRREGDVGGFKGGTALLML
ncbi:hypothetical protein E2C01_008479 [Portunus trituberculatus]|uniref:Uncharacterized protein n=1 Tax=Portunus trituberculatus TaxID=210409 RepID=A0A5B7D1X1_PORTR|nr:hypothetical protein [Portunus trituberculatus]